MQIILLKKKKKKKKKIRQCLLSPAKVWAYLIEKEQDSNKSILN